MIEFWQTHYIFLVVALSVTLLGMSSAIIGSVLVFSKQSQLGDALSHSAYPGILLLFAITQSRHPFWLTLGSILASLIALLLITYLKKHSNFHPEAIMALTLSSFFGIGMVLLSYLENQSTQSSVGQAGLSAYLIGQAAYLKTNDLILIAVIAIISISLFIFMYPKIKLSLFDPVFAHTIGIDANRILRYTLILALLNISIGLKAVGTILMSSLLILPTTIALQWSKRYVTVLGIAVVVSVTAALLGSYISTYYSGFATGPTIVMILFVMALISFIVGPYRKMHTKGGE